jgi:raffinose/stachyose/melibiose transport system substrate-binding protein
MKKISTMLVSVGLAASMALTGCASQNASDTKASATPVVKQDKVKVRMAYWNKEDSVKSLLDLIKQKLPNIELEYQFIDNKQFDNIVATQLAAQSGPDIISVSPPTSAKYAKLGYLADLNSLADRYNDAGKNVYTTDGKLYALPGISWFEGIFYNKEIFDEYGLKPPTTFDEELKLHESLKKSGVKPQAMGA